MAPGQIEHISTKRIVSKLSSNQGRKFREKRGTVNFIHPCLAFRDKKDLDIHGSFFSFKLKETQKEGFEHR